MGRIDALAFSTNADRLISLSREFGNNAVIKIWSVDTLQLLTESKVPSGSFGVQFHPEGARIGFWGPDLLPRDWPAGGYTMQLLDGSRVVGEHKFNVTP